LPSFRQAERYKGNGVSRKHRPSQADDLQPPSGRQSRPNRSQRTEIPAEIPADSSPQDDENGEFETEWDDDAPIVLDLGSLPTRSDPDQLGKILPAPADSLSPELILSPAAQSPQTCEFQVEAPDQGRRIDIYLAEKFPELSRVKLRRTIAAGHVQVDDEIVKPAFRLEPGQQLRVTLPGDLFVDDQQGEAIDLDILYEDEAIIAINKTAGMVVHPAKGHWRGTLTSGLIHRFRQLSAIGGATRPGIVHRLDRETSGVILVAKTDQAHMSLVEQFQNRTVQKQYWAIVSPAPSFDQDRIDMPIGKHPYQRERMAIRENHATSRPAETVFQVMERFRGFAVLKVMPKTGRTHQIRVHLAHVGCPVLCDRLYSGRASLTEAMLHGGVDQAAGNDQSAILKRQALHAQVITFQHPISQQTLTIEAPMPHDLQQTWAALRRIRALN
jgi:23S rRNA pseudouridine1911/1915/1917 synthase